MFPWPTWLHRQIILKWSNIMKTMKFLWLLIYILKQSNSATDEINKCLKARYNVDAAIERCIAEGYSLRDPFENSMVDDINMNQWSVHFTICLKINQVFLFWFYSGSNFLTVCSSGHDFAIWQIKNEILYHDIFISHCVLQFIFVY